RTHGACRPWTALRQRAAGSRDSGNRRTQHRPRHRCSFGVRWNEVRRRRDEAPHERSEKPVIFGVGTDIVEIARMQQTYDRFGERFVERLLMPEERALFASSKWPVRFLAMRFAGKEATVKEVGTGFAHGVWIRD